MLPDNETRKEIKEGAISLFSILCLAILALILIFKFINYVKGCNPHF
jgi:hypothetical protein